MKSIQPPNPPGFNRVNTHALAPARQNGGRTTHGGTTTPLWRQLGRSQLGRSQLGRSQNDARWDHHAAVAHPPRSNDKARHARNLVPSAQRSGGVEGRRKIVPDVFNVFDADAEPQKARVDVGVTGVLVATFDGRLDPTETRRWNEQTHR